MKCGMRVRGWIPLALALLVAFLMALPHPLASQDRRPLSPDHWSYGLREALHALGLSGATLPLIRGSSMAAHLTEMELVEGGAAERGETLAQFLEGWAARLGEEGGGEGQSFYGEATLGWEDDPSLPAPSDEGYLRALVSQELPWGGSLWADGVLAQESGNPVLRSAGLSFPAGPFDLFLGRVPISLGQGRDPFILNGRKGLDGAFLDSREPFRLPGFLQGLGPAHLHLGFSPLFSTPTVSSTWWGSFGLTLSPHPRVDLGFLRTVRFAGEGLDGWSLGNVAGLLTATGEDNSFDDSQGELALRVRWDLLGQPFSTYLSLGFEDKATVYEDPGLMVGVLAPFLRPEALYTARYEFLAFGSKARWCSSCPREFHAWYRHPAFGDYLLDGIPLGAMLGGYGASQMGRLEGWFSGKPIRAWAEFQHLSRGGRNLIIILDGAPSRVEVWTLGLEHFMGETPISGVRWKASGALRSVSLDGKREMAFSASLTFIPGKHL